MIGVGICLDVETWSSAPGKFIDMKGSSSVAGASLWLWIGVESLTVDGTAVGRGFKKESINLSFFPLFHFL